MVAGLAVGFVLLCAGPTVACRTPVYRYAMYNWPSSPYYIFYFGHGEVPDRDAKIHELIEALATDEKAPANLVLEKVDASDAEALKRFPRAVKEAYEAHADGDEPFHVVFSPWGIAFHSGPLEEQTLKAMVDSPARQKIGQLLHEGHLTVLVLLPGNDQAANERAEKEAKKLIADLDSGEIDLGPDPSAIPDPYEYGFAEPGPDEPSGPGDEPPADDGAPEPAGNKPSSDGPGEEQPTRGLERKVALVKLARDDPAEQWLVKALMQIEPDLDEYVDEPMVFGVYGRGRAMPPFIGKGITENNLVDLLFFLSGACSCQIKEQNPGMDLPMARDWDAAAEAIAATDPAFAYDPYAYGEYPVHLPEQAAEEAQPQDQPETSEGAEGDEPQQPAVAAADDASSVPEAPTAETTGTGAAKPAGAGQGDPKASAVTTEARGGEPAGRETTSGGTRPRGSTAARLRWTIGLGAAVAAILAVGAGFAILRRRPL